MMNEQHKRQKNNTQITGNYHLHEKTGNYGWKIKWFAPFEWETPEKISCDLRGCNFSTHFSLLS